MHKLRYNKSFIVMAGVVMGAVATASFVGAEKPSQPPVIAVQAGQPAEELEKAEEARKTAEEALRKAVHQRIAFRVGQAEAELRKQVHARLRDLDRFFERAKKSAPQFAEEALGWRIKWLVIKSQVSNDATAQLQQELTKLFEQHVMKRADLERELKRMIALLQKDVKEIENRLLVDVQADLEDLPEISGIAKPQIDREALNKALEDIRHKVCVDLGADVIQFIVSEVLGHLATRAAIGSAALGGGVAGGSATLGISLVVGLVIDIVFEWVYDWLVDPQGQITTAVCKGLDELRVQLRKGLKPTLLKFADKWARQTGEALEQVLVEGN